MLLSSCHFFRVFLLAAIKADIFAGTLCNEEFFLQICGVEGQAAFWTVVLKCSTACVMSSSVVRESCISMKSFTRFWNRAQFVLKLCKWQGGTFLFLSLLRCKIIGEWSDERSWQELQDTFGSDIPFPMKKSIRSGIFLISVGP